MRWRKVLGDLRAQRLSFALIALVLVLGAAGVVAALDAKAILAREIAASFEMAQAPDVVLWFDRVEPRMLAEIAAREDVSGAAARRVVYTRVAAADGTWLPMRLTLLRDIASQQVGAVHRHGGPPPGNERGIWIEQSGASLLAAGAGEQLRLRTPTGEVATLPVAGFVHDAGVAPSTQERLVYAYATPESAAALGQNPELDEVVVRTRFRGDAGDAARFGDELAAALKAGGWKALRVEPLASAHPHAPLMNAMLRVLGVLAAIAFACSAALAGFLVSAWMKREARQVGIMKAMGARRHQVALQYTLIAGLLALLVAALSLPLGAALGDLVVKHYVVALNIDALRHDVPAALSLEEAAVALGIVILAMAWPIARASRMSVREAIQDAGIAAPLGAGARLARPLAVPGNVRWTFALRNTLRRPFRLVLILLALSSGGALLLTTHSNYDSLMRVIDASLASQGHDIEVVMTRAFPAAQLQSAALRAPGVRIAEAWRRASTRLETGTATAGESKRVALVGYPPETRLFKLPVVEGRVPGAGAMDEVLITRTVQEAIPDLVVGSVVELPFRDRRARVRVTGLVEEIGTPTIYCGFATFEAVTGSGDASTLLRARADDGHLESVARALDQALLDARMVPGQLITRAMFRDALDEHFKVVGEVLRMVALAAALVGAVVLAASTGFNVLERMREIGIVRALGATPRAIAALFVVEGVAVALVAALLAIALSIALTLALNEAAARTLLHVAVPLRFSLPGLAILCGGAVVVVLTVMATVAFALRRPVREALSYE